MLQSRDVAYCKSWRSTVVEQEKVPMLQCWERSEVAVLSGGVDDTWYCEELLVFKEVS